MTRLRRWLLGDLAERVETLENWCRHHDAPRPARSLAQWLDLMQRTQGERSKRLADLLGEHGN